MENKNNNAKENQNEIMVDNQSNLEDKFNLDNSEQSNSLVEESNLKTNEDFVIPSKRKLKKNQVSLNNDDSVSEEEIIKESKSSQNENSQHSKTEDNLDNEDTEKKSQKNEEGQDHIEIINHDQTLKSQENNSLDDSESSSEINEDLLINHISEEDFDNAEIEEILEEETVEKTEDLSKFEKSNGTEPKIGFLNQLFSKILNKNKSSDSKQENNLNGQNSAINSNLSEQEDNLLEESKVMETNSLNQTDIGENEEFHSEDNLIEQNELMNTQEFNSVFEPEEESMDLKNELKVDENSLEDLNLIEFTSDDVNSNDIFEELNSNLENINADKSDEILEDLQEFEPEEKKTKNEYKSFDDLIIKSVAVNELDDLIGQNEIEDEELDELEFIDEKPLNPEQALIKTYDEIIEKNKKKLQSENHTFKYEDLTKPYKRDNDLVSKPQKVTFDQLTTLIEIVEDENNNSNFYSPSESEILAEDTTAATGLPKLSNVLNEFNTEEDSLEFEESVNTISSELTSHEETSLDESSTFELNELTGSLGEEPIVEKSNFYSSTDLLRELEAGRYQETIQEPTERTDTSFPTDFVESPLNDFVAPERPRRVRKNRRTRLDIDITSVDELEQQEREIFSDLNNVISSENNTDHLVPPTNRRRKETKRRLRRQEQLQRQKVNKQTRELTQNLQTVENASDDLIFTKVSPNILKGGITLFNNLARQMQSNGALRVESLMSVLGSLAGYSTQAAAREKLIRQLRLSEDQVFSVVTTADGSKYYFGDTIDRALQKDKHSVWYMTATAVYNLTGKVDSNIDEIVRYSTRNLGKPNFGIPRIAKNLKPSHYPQYYVEHMWSALIPGLERFADDPMDWPVIFGVALQRALICTRGILDPNISLRIILESAVPMSIASIYPIELSTAKNKEEAENQLINQLLTEIDVIRKTLTDDRLTNDQKLSLFEELTQKNERLTVLLNR